MEIIKHGGHFSLESDETTARIVHDVLVDIRDNGIEAVRKYSQRFDSWDPPRFELSQEEIDEATEQVPESARQDIKFCQEQVREFARKQRETMKPLEVETLPGLTLGHNYIPVQSWSLK